MQAVLFDLDGTLLDIELSTFLDSYFAALAETLSGLMPPQEVGSAMRAMGSAVDAMMKPHPGTTNETVFYDDFAQRSGVDLRDHKEVFDCFYEETFPHLGSGYGPVTGSREAIQAARDSGLKVAVATNPIFPRRAIEHRLSWAQLNAEEMDVVTTFETMGATKPHGAYFRQTAEMLGVDPTECMMVGDDPGLDMPAADVGMSTYFVGPQKDVQATYSGALTELPDLLQRLCG